MPGDAIVAPILSVTNFLVGSKKSEQDKLMLGVVNCVKNLYLGDPSGSNYC